MDDRRDLADLGWDDAWSAKLSAAGLPDGVPARVARVDRGGWLTLDSPEGLIRARQHPRFRRITDPLELPIVGDWVVAAAAEGEPPMVDAILPRRSVFVRGDAELDEAQAIAANIDVALILIPATARHSGGRIDRFLTLAWSSGAAPVILVTKADAVDDISRCVAQVEAEALGVPVHAISATEGIGLGALDAYRGAGTTLVLLGASGVGKSTLANRMLGAEIMTTSQIRRDGRGRHTTTHREMVRLPGGGVLIDTPGLRALGMHAGESAAEDQAFVDIVELQATCRFSNCSHASEPGCAVLAALSDGTLSPDRWQRYQALQRELGYMARKRDAALQAAETAKWKAIQKRNRERYRSRGER
ncbi:MAG TPA: ribosome small subunit-dependent GTPase A [Egibacteraceae bacterium]|nr:ribosome small subunit-dependent GTPase A [Egibacteraceae bacterium]